MKNEDLFKGSTNSILFTHKIKELEKQQEDQMINQIIFKKYEVKKKLGKSSTIDIYEGVSLEDDKPVLIKIEPKTSEKLYLETEAYNLYTFKGFGIPELIKLGKKNNNLILIESKKGRSLYDLFVENNRKFSLNEICLIGIQCIERLKFIHSKNYIHRNIKPENFVIGLDDPHVIYLQNFYLCEKYRSSKTNQHAKFKYTKEIVGTERYGSVNALRGLRQGRRDDLESLCYMLIYFFLGKLPWQGISADSETERHQKLLKEKKSFKIENYKQIPKDFYTLFNYVKNLKFEEEPKYSLMIKLIQNIRNENQCFSNVNLFWVKKNNECKGGNIKTKKEGFRERLYSKIGNSVKSEEKNMGIKFIKNIDVNIENIGEGYIDDDDDREDEEEGEDDVNNSTHNGKSAYQLKVNRSISCEESNNKNQGNNNNNEENEENNSYREDELNHSNSSINTKVYKLNGAMELFIKKDIMNDEDINKIDGLQNNKSEQEMSKISKNNTQTIIEEDNEGEGEGEEVQENAIQENNSIKNNIKNYSSSNSNIKEGSTKVSIQFNNKDSYGNKGSKGSNNDPSTIIIVKDSNNESKKEEDKKDKNNIITNISSNNGKNIEKVKKKKSVDAKILITKKNNINKFGQISGPEVKLNRPKSSKKSDKKNIKNNKDCIIF